MELKMIHVLILKFHGITSISWFCINKILSADILAALSHQKIIDMSIIAESEQPTFSIDFFRKWHLSKKVANQWLVGAHGTLCGFAYLPYRAFSRP